jgi:hypothetical protein
MLGAGYGYGYGYGIVFCVLCFVLNLTSLNLDAGCGAHGSRTLTTVG